MPSADGRKTVAEILASHAKLLDLSGASPFKVRAYDNASRVVAQFEGDLAAAAASGELAREKGIGAGTLEKIREILAGGSFPQHDELLAATPPGLVEMLRIPGLGAKKVRVLHDELGVETVGELEYACKENRLVDLPGFGAKTQDNVLRGIRFFKRNIGRFLIDHARQAAEEIAGALQQDAKAHRCVIAGSLRRWRETIGDIDILCTTSDPAGTMDFFTSMNAVEHVSAHGETKSSVVLAGGINVDLRVVSEDEFPFALLYFTGSKEHNIAVRGRASKMGYKLNEYGLFRGDERVACRDEAEVFDRLGLSFIEPELRENTGEVEAAGEGMLPDLVAYDDIAGTFHVHTNASDGVGSLADMARAAGRLGLTYIGIADHSEGAGYAGGLAPDRVRAQHAEIDRFNKAAGDVHLFKGIEVEIRTDGSVDYDDELLASFDFVIAAVHSGFTQSREDMTERVIRAVSNPYVTMLAHPTGRLLLARKAYEIDLPAVLRAAKQHDVIVEINASPHRLDLDWRACRQAQALGLEISINPDAHQPEGIAEIRYGVAVARKGWLGRENIFNALPLAEMKRRLASSS